MISDLQSEIDHIDYTPDGKVHRIYKTSGAVILFVYDAKGDRVCKVSSEGYYYYFRDANGEILEVIKFNPPSDPGNLWEQILVDLETSGVGTHEVQKKPKQSKQNIALSGGPLSCVGITWNSTFDSTNNYWNCWSSYDLNIVDPLNNPFLLAGEPDFANMYGFAHNEWFIYGAEGHGRFATYKAN
jgi:hypothetical protein